jgi:uncharacterized membrane protein YhaH (DUF805 family)
MFKNPFSFSGRIRRTEFGLSVIISVLVMLGASLFAEYDNQFTEVLFFMIFITVLWFMLAQGTKRCQDRGNSGFYMLIPFYRYWMLFANSDYGENYYGPNPKGLGNNMDEIDLIGQDIENN